MTSANTRSLPSGRVGGRGCFRAETREPQTKDGRTDGDSSKAGADGPASQAQDPAGLAATTAQGTRDSVGSQSLRGEGRPRWRRAGQPGPRSPECGSHCGLCGPALAPGPCAITVTHPNACTRGPGTPRFLQGCMCKLQACGLPAGAKSLASTVSCASANLAAHTTDVPTEAGTGQMLGLRSAGQEMTEPALAPVWLGLKATLSRAPGSLLQLVAGVGGRIPSQESGQQGPRGLE